MLTIWRHPKPVGAAGRCIGRTDLAVDPRKAKRLAHRIRAAARREGGPREVWTSPLRRAAAVGRWLRRWGWTHHVDARLAEADFGAWDGRPWAAIPRAEFDAWVAGFLAHRPGGGESVADLRARVDAFLAGRGASHTWAVGHAGWISAWATRHSPGLEAAHWPPAIGYGARLRAPPRGPAGP